MNNVILYVHAGDAACRAAEETLKALEKEFPHALEIRDVDQHADWRAAAGPTLPAAEINGRMLPVPLQTADLRSALALGKAIASYKKETAVPAPVMALSRGADRFAAWFSRHWLGVFNVLVGLYIGLAFAPPVLMEVGLAGPAEALYKFYGFSCHQLGYRSFFLFGEQMEYPRAVFQSVSGINPDDLWASRAFLGSDDLGWKIALCERDVAIYGGLLFFGIGFHFVRRRLRPLPTLGWILLGIVPIGLDGGTQLLSYLPFLDIPARESTPLLRVITGLCFAAASVWFAYPYVEESMAADVAAAQPAPRA